VRLSKRVRGAVGVDPGGPAGHGGVMGRVDRVEDAEQVAATFLKKVGALVSDIVTVVKELFNWSDIISTKLGLEAALNQIPGVVSVGLFARRPADVVIVGGEPPLVF